MSLLIQQYEAFIEDSGTNVQLLMDYSPTTDNETMMRSLKDYDGYEQDLIWWSWRLRLADELDQKAQRLYDIPF